MKIVIDFSLCDGNGVCAAEAPMLIEMGADDTPVIIREAFGEDELVCAKAAVNGCPKAAVSIVE